MTEIRKNVDVVGTVYSEVVQLIEDGLLDQFWIADDPQGITHRKVRINENGVAALNAFVPTTG